MKLRYIPNILSITRLLLVPVFVVLFLNDHIPAAVAVFLLAGATDVADGYLARKFEWTSTLGRLLDPVADKFLQMSAFVCLWLTHRIPWWMVAVYFVKELATAVGAAVIFRKGRVVVASNVFGKAATVLVFAAVFAIALFYDKLGNTGTVVICLLVTLYFVFSVGVYCGEELIKFFKKDAKNPQKTADKSDTPS